MNIKSLFLCTLFMVANPIMAMVPGTIIDPLNHTGQFTVSEFKNTLPNASKSISECTSSLCQVTTDLFKTKGVPVLISSAASALPWWALTTGTGYLLISQAGITQEGLSGSVINGATYAIGEKTAQQSNAFTQIALCAACCAVSYTTSTVVIQEACFSIAQSLTLSAVVDAANVLWNNQPISTIQKTESPTVSKPITNPSNAPIYTKIMQGSINTLKTIMPAVCFGIIQTQDTNSMIRILLYEQAYRLAQSGCAAAQEFLHA